MSINIYEQKKVVENYSLSRDIPENILLEYVNLILKETNPTRICDFGFGVGTVLIPLIKQSNGIEVLGIDSSYEICNLVKKKKKN